MARITPQPFYASDRAKATYLTGREPRLVVSFTGVGKPDTRVQDEEFVGYGSQDGRNHVFAQLVQRSHGFCRRNWREYRDMIAAFTCLPLETTISPDCRYFILHGGGDVERPHWSRFPKGGNIHHYLVGGAGHGVGRRLKSSGLIKPATHFAIAGRPRAFRMALKDGMRLHRPK